MQRYEWEDSLIQAQIDGLINDASLLTALKLSKAINWKPTKRNKAGLYWSNDMAADNLGIKRATFYRNVKVLKKAGFLIVENGNLIPSLNIETGSLKNETGSLNIETEESHQWDTFSEDIYSEDTFSDDSYSEDSCSVSADAPTAQQTLTKEEGDMEPSLGSKIDAAENPTLGLEDEPSLDLNKPVPLDPKTGSAESDSKGESQSETSWINFKESKTELCQHDKIGFCRKCDTADLADLQDAVSLL